MNLELIKQNYLICLIILKISKNSHNESTIAYIYSIRRIYKNDG